MSPLSTMRMQTRCPHKRRTRLPSMSSAWKVTSWKIHPRLLPSSRQLCQHRPNTPSPEVGSPSLQPQYTVISGLQNLLQVCSNSCFHDLADSCRGILKKHTGCDTANTATSRCPVKERTNHTSTPCTSTGKTTHAADTPNSTDSKHCTNRLQYCAPALCQECESRALDWTRRGEERAQ